MIARFFIGLVRFVLSIVGEVMGPMVDILSEYVPGFSSVLSMINSFITTIINFFPWILSWLNIPGALLSFACDVLINIITLKLMFHGIKIGLAWYDALKP